jgi:hypothetical protein
MNCEREGCMQQAADDLFQAGVERRIEGERRRSPRGWLELRARREGIEVDRRRPAGRPAGWMRLLPFWRSRT